MSNYKIEYFIELFSNIPEENWGICSPQKNYVLEHLGVSDWSEVEDNSPAAVLWELFDTKLNTSFKDVNDGIDRNFQQPTPKLRILAACEMIGLGKAPRTFSESQVKELLQKQRELCAEIFYEGTGTMDSMRERIRNAVLTI